MSSAHALERTSEQVDRLRRHSRIWERATGRLIDEVALECGARCLDARCGPGEVMRLLAQRVGPTGHVTGVDSDGALGAAAIASLHASGHRQCAFVHADIAAADPFPGERFDLVYARHLLAHVDDAVAALGRLWSWTAPGGHLVVQEYELGEAHLGHLLPALLAAAGIGAPDGVDVAGRLEPVEDARLALGALAGRVLAEPAGGYVLWPLLVGVHKRKDSAPGR
jgi:ubiquinone/menaquinone biosynthesis C-methylase UbiE